MANYTRSKRSTTTHQLFRSNRIEYFGPLHGSSWRTSTALLLLPYRQRAEFKAR